MGSVLSSGSLGGGHERVVYLPRFPGLAVNGLDCNCFWHIGFSFWV